MYMVEFVLMKDSDCISLWTLKPQKEWCNRIKIYCREQVEKAMATHSSVLAWRIPGTAEPGGVTQSQRWLKRLSSSSRSIESRREQKRHCRTWRTEGLAWPLIQDSIFKSRDITLPTKVHLVKAMVFPVVMYGCESWTVKKAECQRVDAFELWCWRTLESPLDCKEIQPVHPKGDQSWVFIGRLMLKLKLQYFGHLMQSVDSFEKTLMLGKIDGRRRRGRQRMRWLDGITDSMDMGLDGL